MDSFNWLLLILIFILVPFFKQIWNASLGARRCKMDYYRSLSYSNIKRLITDWCWSFLKRFSRRPFHTTISKKSFHAFTAQWMIKVAKAHQIPIGLLTFPNLLHVSKFEFLIYDRHCSAYITKMWFSLLLRSIPSHDDDDDHSSWW